MEIILLTTCWQWHCSDWRFYSRFGFIVKLCEVSSNQIICIYLFYLSNMFRAYMCACIGLQDKTDASYWPHWQSINSKWILSASHVCPFHETRKLVVYWISELAAWKCRELSLTSRAAVHWRCSKKRENKERKHIYRKVISEILYI